MTSPSTASAPSPALLAFLEPLQVDQTRIVALSRAFAAAFTHLAAESTDQFLPTPIAESVLLPINRKNKNQGRYLAIDIGGTNLRVGFVELLGDDGPGPGPGPAPSAASQAENQRPGKNSKVAETTEHFERAGNGNAQKEQPLPLPPHPPPHPARGSDKPCLQRLHERSWPIQEHLKNENADSLFAWIGGCIAAVVREGCASFGLARDATLPMGVTFSFPMEQDSLSEARLMSMGKGFAITGHLDLGSYLIKGYEMARRADPADLLPPVAVAAITNDAVATLVSFTYERSSQPNQKAAMGLICGTGCNATLLLNKAKLHPSKRWAQAGTNKATAESQTAKIVVNTEWSINGTAPAMRKTGFISRWDDQLSQAVESPGFQPLEYMTAGRYLGELGRIMLAGYMRSVLGVDETTLPAKFLRKFEPRNTQFLGHYQTGRPQSFRAMLEAEFPTAAHATEPNGHETHHANGGGTKPPPFRWTDEIAEALYHIAKAIETRAAAIVAAGIVGLLDCADELPPRDTTPQPPAAAVAAAPPLELVVGYTGGCIINFQDYLADCQGFLDDLVAQRYGCPRGDGTAAPWPSGGPAGAPVRIVLRPCHDGGIKGAGILVPVALASRAAAVE